MSYLRMAVIAAVLLVLAGLGWKLRVSGEKAGRAEVQALWDTERAQDTAAKLAESEKRRMDEKRMTTANQGISNENAKKRSLELAADRATADRLRELEAAAAASRGATPDSATGPGSDDDPRPEIIAECARAYRQVDTAARELERKTKGLQDYAAKVCVTQ